MLPRIKQEKICFKKVHDEVKVVFYRNGQKEHKEKGNPAKVKKGVENWIKNKY